MGVDVAVEVADVVLDDVTVVVALDVAVEVGLVVGLVCSHALKPSVSMLYRTASVSASRTDVHSSTSLAPRTPPMCRVSLYCSPLAYSSTISSSRNVAAPSALSSTSIFAPSFEHVISGGSSADSLALHTAIMPLIDCTASVQLTCKGTPISP